MCCMDEDRQGCCWDDDGTGGVEMRMVVVRDEDRGRAGMNEDENGASIG